MKVKGTMHFTQIHFIINPAAGGDEPIETYIEEALKDKGITWHIKTTQNEDDAYNTAKQLAGNTDLIIVYGGDGSVSQVANALHSTDTPMAIIPGGTANVLSKELGIPQDAKQALDLILGDQSHVVKMDMGQANENLFLLRINLGIMADMILNADIDLKKKLGQTAYGVSAIKTIVATEPVKYNLLIDGKEFNEEGVSLTITNAGNIGVAEMSFLPGISIYDGYLDVILLHRSNPLSLLQVAGSTLFQTESDVLKHWRCKEIKIIMEQQMAYICDDFEEEATIIDIKIIPNVLNILVPYN